MDEDCSFFPCILFALSRCFFCLSLLSYHPIWLNWIRILKGKTQTTGRSTVLLSLPSLDTCFLAFLTTAVVNRISKHRESWTAHKVLLKLEISEIIVKGHLGNVITSSWDGELEAKGSRAYSYCQLETCYQIYTGHNPVVKAAINIRVESPKREGKTRWLLRPVNYACSDDLAFLPLKGGYLSLNPSPVHAILLFPRRAVSIRQPESSLSKWSLLKSLSARWKQVRSNRGQQVG